MVAILCDNLCNNNLNMFLHVLIAVIVMILIKVMQIIKGAGVNLCPTVYNNIILILYIDIMI